MFFKKKRKGDELKELTVKVDEVYVAMSKLNALENVKNGRK